jgi:hypothetical protein
MANRFVEDLKEVPMWAWFVGAGLGILLFIINRSNAAAAPAAATVGTTPAVSAAPSGGVSSAQDIGGVYDSLAQLEGQVQSWMAANQGIYNPGSYPTGLGATAPARYEVGFPLPMGGYSYVPVAPGAAVQPPPGGVLVQVS